jgi:malate synthase
MPVIGTRLSKFLLLQCKMTLARHGAIGYASAPDGTSARLARVEGFPVMADRTNTGGIKVATVLWDFINAEVLPGTDVDQKQFWAGLDATIHELAPRNRGLLAKRDDLQARIDAWHRAHPAGASGTPAYKAFLAEIGYIVPEGGDFRVDTANVDPEIATIAGPQLVVPVMNARYALNAANARWGSLYDALYGSDVISEDDGAARTSQYNPGRGGLVMRFARDLLDEIAPLKSGSHRDAKLYICAHGALIVTLRTVARPVCATAPPSPVTSARRGRPAPSCW